MKQAMVFAAGLGTRLKPITDTMPKALVRVGDKPLLWHVVMKLKSAGYERIVINVHHFAQQIVDYVTLNHCFDMDIRISDYQMYLSGERLENFSGVFGWFTGPITTFVGLIIPLLMLRGGFNSNFDVLFIDESRSRIIVVPIIMDIIGYLLMSIPYFFWDYDDKKQNAVMEVLRRREEVTRKQMEEGDDSTPEENVAAALEAEETEATENEAVEVMS